MGSASARSPSPDRRSRGGRSPRPEASRSRDDDERLSDRTGLVRTSQPAKREGLREERARLSTTRAGGAYIPPARLRAMMAEAAQADPSSVEYQRMRWDALKKTITGLVNKVAADNIRAVVPELFGSANLIRGRGLFCRSIMRAQMQSLPFTPVFAALASIVNTKLPMVGELLVHRLVSQFRRAFRRNDKPVCHATIMFIAHLVNQRVVHEILALEILVLLLEKPTDDSVELAVGFMREVGVFLAEEAPKANNGIFDRFRAVLYEGQISKRVQYMIEVLAQVRREKYKDNPRIAEALDLVEEEDQITHEVGLEDTQLRIEESLNAFRADSDFLENEQKYEEIKREILGEASGSSSDGDPNSDSEQGSDDGQEADAQRDADQARVEIQDRTETNLFNLRKTIHLTLYNSIAFEEAVHKLLKLKIPDGLEIEFCNTLIESCAQERTFSKFHALIAERLCKLHRSWSNLFETCFGNYYEAIHRYDTNKLRNVARFFGWLIAGDAIRWSCFEIVHMTEEDTTSSSRIFIKILMGEMRERLGLKALVERFKDPTMQSFYRNLMPLDEPKATRFSINFFTSIGIPQVTDGMRQHLQVVRQEALAKAQLQEQDASDSDSSLSSSSYTSSSYSSRSYSSRSYSSRSRSYDSRSPPPRRRYRSRSYSDSRSPSRSPSPRAARSRRRSPSYSVSRSVSSRSRSPSYSVSRSASSRSPSPRRDAPVARRRTARDAFSPERSPQPVALKRRRASRSPSFDSRSPSRSPPPRSERQ